MSKLKASEEFMVGKHSIGWIDSDFTKAFGNDEFDEVAAPTFQKLVKSMKDSEIETGLKPGICTLGDVLAFLKNPVEEYKDGFSNLFYFSEFVVYVNWYGGDWYVNTWYRYDYSWFAGYRIFSPATKMSNPKELCQSIYLEDRVARLEKTLEAIRTALLA